ncbi:uncharacterized protein LOC110512591 isoform X2 [Oncorhynchus mykiss]|uniref:uncharacterized protein LOC110512591 isoform X2 n=1 Tax=Oncorhynchus mykiss TaxID=8022 RepID=UPI0018781D31|nr:uncharacterized protein LOC110512591 isoform X2 [Oncorhynchus mykiss]
MNRAGRPLFMKTYGKQNRKLEAWISPDNRKQVFASTSSSDLSIVEPSSPKPPAKRVRKRSTADISRELRPAKTKALSWTADISRELRLAKTKALSCLREQDSDEENIFIVHPPPQQQSNRKPFLRRAGRKARRIVSSSESDGETTTTRQPNPKRSQHTTARARTHTHPSPVLAPGKFVTHRRGATTTTAKHKAPKRKLSVLLAQLSLNSSDDFVQGGREEGGVVQRSFPRRAKQGRRRALANADSSLADLGNSGATNSKGFLRDISLNVSPERPCHRKPLFSSTPSSRSLPPPPSFLRPPISPSASDIISLSTTQEELDIPEDPLSLTELRQLSSLGQAVGQPEVGNREEPTPRGSTSLRSNGSRNGGSAIQDGVGEQPSPELFSAVACEQTDPGRAGEETEDGSHFVSATVGQDWLAEVVKERCLTRCCAVRLERVYKLHGDTTCSPCVDQTRSHDNGRSVDHVRSATRGQSIDHSVIRDPSRDHTGSVTEGQSVDRAVNDSGQSLGRIVSVSRTSEEPVRVEQRLTTHCEVQLGRLTVTRPHRETSLTVTRPHRETSLTETRPHRETSLTETRPHTSLTETRPHRETSLTVTRPHRETSLTETRPHRETSLTETRPHRETSLTETRPHRETSLTETRPHRETSLTVTQPHRETSLTETRPHRETSLTVTRPHRETSLLPSDHNPRSDSSTAGDHARSEHVPRDSLVPKEHVPRDSLVPKDHVPRDSLVPKEHVPRDSLVPKEHVPRDSLVPKEHVPRDSLVPKEHVPRDSLVPKEHVPRDSLVPKEHVPRDSLVPKEHVPRDSLVPKEHVPRDSLVPKEHVPRDSLFPKEHVPKENPHRRKVGGAPIERRRRSVSRERPATSRKVCVSGVSVSRWGRRDGAPNSRAAPPPGRAGDCSITELLSAQHTHGVPILSDSMVLGTPVRGNRLHLSSLLVNLTPETHTWSRLKAALSLHRKTKAFLTPKRPLYLLSSPEAELEAELGDVSQKLFSTPRPPNLRSTIQGSTPLSVYSLDGELSDDQKVFLECNQTGPLGFQDCLPAARMKLCRKIGEGTFGEVFSTTNTSGDAVALKIIPVEGCDQVNGEEQKTFGEILHEIIISKELSSLKEKKHNQTTGFIGLKDLHCVKGCYPPSLLKAWDSFNTQRGSENDRPDFFNEEQLFLILEFEFGGSDLENSNGQLASVMVSKSILHQVTAALAVAEQELCFEHRDLHWGNVLVQSTKEKEGSFLLNGTNHSLETRGVSVRIIDYSLSRLEIDGLTVSCDISEDEELFQGHGDLQFDIYRLMRQENGNKWGDYQPHSNVLWLHYLSSKLLTMTYKSRGGRGVKQARLDLQRFHDDVLTFRSASDILYNCGLFQ